MKYFITGILLLTVLVSCYQKESSNLQATHLVCEWNEAPLGIETTSPALSWQIMSDVRNVRQTAYRVLVADSPEQLASGEWKSITENGEKVKTHTGENGRKSVNIGSRKYRFILE